MVNDVVADFLTSIRNATLRSKTNVSVRTSKMIEAIARILKEEGYIEDFIVEDGKLTLTLKYVDNKSAITQLERVSKPGIRRYVGYNEIPKVISGMGINIISTSKGLMTGKKAKDAKLGGEYICNIW